MKNKKWIGLLMLGMLAAMPLCAIDFGFIAGTQSDTQKSGLMYGLSGNMGMIVPVLKMEWEGYRYSEMDGYTMSVGAKLKLRFGAISPYAACGVGIDFLSLNFDFSQYTAFTFLAFGCHMYLIDFISLRADVRFQYFTLYTRNRFSAGIFLHL